MNDVISILIADDHPLMRNGLKFVLESEPNLTVTGEAKNGNEALQFLMKKSFDIVTLDVEMPFMSGLEISRKILEEKINTRVVFLTMYKDEDMFNQAMDLGAMGYVLKENAVNDIVDCIKCVAGGKYYISPTLSQYLISRERRIRNLSEKSPSLSILTKSERHILHMIAEEKSTRQIAEELHVSYKTVENHRANISRKLNLQGTLSLIKYAMNHKSIL